MLTADAPRDGAGRWHHEEVSSDPVFDERLLPRGWLWLAPPVLAAMAFAALLPLGRAVAIVAATLAGVGSIVAILRGSPRIVVDGTGLRVGRAFLEPAFIGAVQPLDRDGTRAAMGPELRADAHTVYRAWVRTACRVEVVDDQDPTPYWLISTRRPESLAASLQALPGRPVPTAREREDADQAAHSEQTGSPPSE